MGAEKRANLPHQDIVDGIRCKKSDWDPTAVDRPFFHTNSGTVKGKHNCKAGSKFVSEFTTPIWRPSEASNLNL